MFAVSAIGGGTPSAWSTLASGAGSDVTTAVVRHETALVRPIDLRSRSAGDGDAWVVLLFGSLFLLVAVGFLVVWLRGRVSKAVAAVVPARVRTESTPTTAPEQFDPYPA
jgi:hypothetical protein